MSQQDTPRSDNRLADYIAATEKLRQGKFDLSDLPVSPRTDLTRLGDNLKALAKALENNNREWQKLTLITSALNSGFLLDEVLDRVYVDFHDFLPYDRMGVSLVDNLTQTVTAIWARTDHPRMRLRKGYTARLEGSSLQTILNTGQPRIINDLEQYLRDHPDSFSTKLVLSEGIRSSITCPLISGGKPIGFIFFSSGQINAYQDAHVSVYQHISEQLSAIVEKSILSTENSTQQAVIARQEGEIRALHVALDGIHAALYPLNHAVESPGLDECRAILSEIRAILSARHSPL